MNKLSENRRYGFAVFTDLKLPVSWPWDRSSRFRDRMSTFPWQWGYCWDEVVG